METPEVPQNNTAVVAAPAAGSSELNGEALLWRISHEIVQKLEENYP